MCVYVCIYVCIFVCFYVCLSACMYHTYVYIIQERTHAGICTHTCRLCRMRAATRRGLSTYLDPFEHVMGLYSFMRIHPYIDIYTYIQANGACVRPLDEVSVNSSRRLNMFLLPADERLRTDEHAVAYALMHRYVVSVARYLHTHNHTVRHCIRSKKIAVHDGVQCMIIHSA